MVMRYHWGLAVGHTYYQSQNGRAVDSFGSIDAREETSNELLTEVEENPHREGEVLDHGHTIGSENGDIEETTSESGDGSDSDCWLDWEGSDLEDVEDHVTGVLTLEEMYGGQRDYEEYD
jgi:hypothetical protein